MGHGDREGYLGDICLLRKLFILLYSHSLVKDTALVPDSDPVEGMVNEWLEERQLVSQGQQRRDQCGTLYGGEV